MSDGNFNRSLLPRNDLSAGLRLGKAQMRAWAEQSLGEVLGELLPDLPAVRRAAIRERFAELLREKGNASR